MVVLNYAAGGRDNAAMVTLQTYPPALLQQNILQSLFFLSHGTSGMMCVFTPSFQFLWFIIPRLGPVCPRPKLVLAESHDMLASPL